MQKFIRIVLSVIVVACAGAATMYAVTKDVDWKRFNTSESVIVSTQGTRVAQSIEKSVYGILNKDTKGQMSSGSGFIYKIDGDTAYLLTNAHVVEDADELKVFFEAGALVDAKVVGEDKNFDVALVKMDKKYLPEGARALPLNEKGYKTGDEVLAMGTPLGAEFFNTTTLGVVSGESRIFVEKTEQDELTYYNEFIQVDAAINHGNSGGPLLNMSGEVVGINTRKLSGDVESPISNLGFAVPSHVVRSVIPYIQKGKEKPILEFGVALDGMNIHKSIENVKSLYKKEDVAGNRISAIDKGSVAEKAGLQVGDIITEVDGSTDVRTSVFARKMLTLKQGDKMSLKVFRGGTVVPLNVTLEKEMM